jgi:hypothetical protein
LIALVEDRWLAAPVPETGEGDGDTCGNAEPRLPVGCIPRPGTVPLGRAVEGIVPIVVPSPAFCVDDDPPSEDFRLMSTVADADVELDASAEVAVAVSVT